jgi:hypothetical protein
MNRTPAFRVWMAIGALAALSLVSRLPQLLSPNLLVDGDEAVLGLMARHVAQAKELPLFFYGQHYGLSTVEAIAGAAAFRLFGMGPVVLKLSMLTLWTAGVLFLFLALTRIVGVTRAFWISAVFLLTPAWAVWSMKARGGYLTAFTAAAASWWLLVQPRERLTAIRWFLVGTLTAIVYLAQPLWLPGVLTMVVAVLVSTRRPSYALAYLAVPGLAIVFLRTTGGPPIGNASLRDSISPVLHQIFLNLTGSYYLWRTLDSPGPATTTLAVAWCVMLVFVGVAQAYRVATRRFRFWSHVLFVGLCATLVLEWYMMFNRDGRYLLPMSGLLVPLSGIELADLADIGASMDVAVAAVTVTVVLLGSLSLFEFRKFTYLWTNPPNGLSETNRLHRVISYLEAEGATHAFSMNGLLDSQLIFYSNEKIVARWGNGRERDMRYVDEVDRALERGDRVAVVGYTNESGAPGCWDVPICTGDIEHLVTDPERIFTVDGKYFAYVGADRALLDKLRFRFPE